MCLFSVSRLWDITASVSDMEQVSCLVVSTMMDTRLLSAKGRSMMDILHFGTNELRALYALDGHIIDITSLSSIETSTETVYASSLTVNGYNLMVQVHSTSLLIIDIGSNKVLYNCKPDKISLDNRIEFATCWQTDGVIYVALCLVSDDAFSLEIINITATR